MVECNIDIEEIAKNVYVKRYPFLSWYNAPYKTKQYYKMVVEEVIEYLKKKGGVK